ncbi:MAG: inorganic phosphate transporter [Pseudonocardia sp.]|uniref:inorganic phosphate transporter n=1 Tax=unclassified Pseudonocardia TaxID=2619320 RepID=UPI0008689279|nr:MULTISPECIES: inorganic phosphate transporter [unclassified Pseudonocardia]MBN9111294.1 inorganic phosphate transporter [Pseudonocardia sp.]ODU24550.1 MAG: phosphate transporter [Pseudonocardia sp. SCN 72-51]ODV06265.1 MAG: phosphate transporter [Pseudonocardia sp. SCN 73-27]
MDLSVIVVVVIVTALIFDFTNGFHDTANAMATSIATGALRPKVAVAVAGVLNLVGAFLSVEVAKTISSGLVNEARITPVVIFAGLVGAILWNLFTWLLGLPSSSSHALFGGLIGATLVAAGASAVNFGTVVTKVVLPAILSPLLAGVIALIATYLAYRITKRGEERTVTKGFKLGQIVSASMVALAHGTNDAQKTMGIITLTLITAGVLAPNSGPPFWVILASGLAIALGTYLGGWRIIQTLGKRVSDIQTPQGFAAESASAAVILTSSHLGFALSTTQVATGSIFGAGAGRRLASVQWGVAGQMAIAWLLTLPAAAAVGAVAAWLASTGTVGTIIVAVVALAVGLGIYAISRRKPVTADNVNDVPTPGEKVPAGTAS